MKTIGDLIVTDTVSFNDTCELNMTEDKVKVDRYKLAEMLQEDGGERAQKFFKRIMLETGTDITWPQQLKTGGKSKRDAYVKIYGNPAGIADAKSKILQVLNIESKNLILKLDVSYDHHSHMIGKDGHNIQRIMDRTGCHIHFPDSNRTNMVEKSNQVSISGHPDKAQEARRLVRESMPIVVKFEIPLANRPPQQDPSGWIQCFQQEYGIIVRFYYTSNGTTVVEVRGPNTKVEFFAKAITELKNYLVGYDDGKLFLTMQVSVQHHAFVKGERNCNINLIKQETNAEIKFPQPSSDGANESHKMAVEISGSFHSVYNAWERLKGLLPLVMTFDLKDGLESQTDSAIIDVLLEYKKRGLQYCTKPKSKQNQNKVLFLKCPERQADVLFYLRKLLLKEEVLDHENSYIHFSAYNFLPPTNYIPVLTDPKLPPSPVAPIIHNIFENFCAIRMLPEINPSSRIPFISDEGSTCASTVSSPSLSPRNDRLDKGYCNIASTDPVPKELGSCFDYCQLSDNSQKKTDESIPAVSANHRYSSLPTEHNLFFTSERNSYNEASHLSSSSRMHPTKAVWNERRCSTHYEDYQWKKQLATKAMKSPVGSEMRVPTGAWHGYGFSKSMPPFVIKNKLLDSFQWASAQSPNNTENIENTAKDVGCLFHDPCLRLGRYSHAGNTFLSSSNCLDATSLRPSVSSMSELGDVPTVLMNMGLEEYTKNFTQHEIDMDTFLTMSEDDLKEVGVKYCHRQRILHKISELKELERKSRRARFEPAPGAERSLLRLAKQRSQISQQKS